MVLPRRFSIYLLREMVPLYGFGMVVLLILLLTDFITSIAGTLLRKQTPILLILQAVLDRLPFLLSYALAPALAFAIMVGLGRMAKDSELKAAFSLGLPPLRLLIPILAFGLVVSGFAFYNINYLQPAADAHFLDTYSRILYDAPLAKYQQAQSYADSKTESLFHAGSITPLGTDNNIVQLSGVLIRTREGVFTASNGTWNVSKKTWELFNAAFTPEKGEVQLVGRRVFNFNARVIPFEPPPEQLSLPELQKRAANPSLLPQERFTAEFKLHRRFADPLAALVMAILGGTFGLMVTNRAWALAGLIALVFAYWVIWTLGAKIASGQGLSAPLAAWLPVIVFSIASLVAARRLA